MFNIDTLLIVEKREARHVLTDYAKTRIMLLDNVALVATAWRSGSLSTLHTPSGSVSTLVRFLA